MSRTIVVREEARWDAIEIAYAIAIDNLEASNRFADAVDAAFRRISELPGIGARREYDNPKLVGMRMRPVPGFAKYLIFYRDNDDEVEVIRVLHGARDIRIIFRPGDRS